jgi:hypothetical protein
VVIGGHADPDRQFPVHLAGSGDTRRGELRHVTVDQVLGVVPGLGDVDRPLPLVDRHPVEDHHLIFGFRSDLGYGLHSVAGVPEGIHSHHDRSEHCYPFRSRAGLPAG